MAKSAKEASNPGIDETPLRKSGWSKPPQGKKVSDLYSVRVNRDGKYSHKFKLSKGTK